jgi:hypothetical protein
LTKEQYSGEYRPRVNPLSASRDTLNPLLNAGILKHRLEMIEHYKLANGGHRYQHWPQYFMQKAGKNLRCYGLNYGVKAFAAYLVYNEYQQYKHLNQTTFVTIHQQANFAFKMASSSAVLAGVCAFI